MVCKKRSESAAGDGFSLTEIIVVMAIMGSVLALALPYFNTIMRRGRLDAEARQLDMALLKGRLEAIKRGNNVCLEASTDPSKASYQSPILYVDSNSNSTLDSGETTIATYPMAPSAANLTFRIDTYNATSPSSASATFTFVFTPFGSSTTAGSSKAVFISDTSGNVVQVGIPIATTGKVAMTKLSGSSYVAPPWNWN
jgi:prepilin-type N-terminal cleavage/methylation domain-containing protein